MKEIKIKIIIMSVSILLSLFFLEFFLIFWNKNKQKDVNISAENRYMLFQEGEVFKNQNKIFKYHSKKKILAKTYYKKASKFIEEYSYYIKTNNFGLVQENDLATEKESILFLGDSYLESVGAYGWVNKFDGNYKNYQIINGGILGVGPQQFELMEEHVVQNFNIKKVIFFYIGDDFRRSIWNIQTNTNICLQNFTKCQGNENFYGFPFNQNKNLESFLDFLSAYRLKINSKKKFFKVKEFVKNLYIIKLNNNFFKKKFYKTNNIHIKKNLSSLKRLHDKYGKNIIFIQLNTKSEIIYGKSYETNYAEKFIKKISNNHFVCNFNNNLKFFFKTDMHPNKTGYDYLYKCTDKILNNNLKLD